MNRGGTQNDGRIVMEKAEIAISLKPGREKSVRRFHPWIFSGAIAKVDGNRTQCGVADVLDGSGEWLARGLWNPSADLAVRLYTWDENEAIDASLFADRVANSVDLREGLINKGRTNAYRLIFSEADALSGIIADRYSNAIVVTISASALTPYLDAILASLRERTGLANIRVVADSDDVEREGIDVEQINRHSSCAVSSVRIAENGIQFDVDINGGQKTGFYLDQRENRMRVAAFAAGRRVLSAYCYTGAFDVYTAREGAKEILGLDSSESALERARSHHALNEMNTPVVYEQADVPVALRRFRDERRTFDMIILDPPRFVFSNAQMEKGMRAYKDINLLAMKLLTPGGILASFSCSGLVRPEDFRTVIRWASVDAGRAVRILETLGQGFDHPVLATFPESEYLKGVICRVE
jgi:23S rRNA (cytosine1962-C5)-methyltransferase